MGQSYYSTLIGNHT